MSQDVNETSESRVKEMCSSIKDALLLLNLPLLKMCPHQSQTSAHLLTTQSCGVLAETRITSWLSHHVPTLFLRTSFQILARCILNRSHKHALTSSHQRHSIKPAGMLLHKKESVSQSFLLCRCKATKLICFLDCPLQVIRKRLVIMQICFRCKMKSACLILIVSWNSWIHKGKMIHRAKHFIIYFYKQLIYFFLWNIIFEQELLNLE